MTDQVAYYLASASPRRRELLAHLDYPFQIVAAPIDERPEPGEAPRSLVMRLAKEKALAGQRQVECDKPVLGSDTIVVVDGEVLGKPQDLSDSQRMLSQLSGRTHQVMTAVAIASAQQCETIVVTTEVTMREISADEQRRYWHSGEPCDKAGSYGIQGIGGKFVTRINGSYSSVVGLPLAESAELLEKYLSSTASWSGHAG